MRPYRGDEFFFVKIGGGDFIEGVDLKWEDNDFLSYFKRKRLIVLMSIFG